MKTSYKQDFFSISFFFFMNIRFEVMKLTFWSMNTSKRLSSSQKLNPFNAEEQFYKVYVITPLL